MENTKQDLTKITLNLNNNPKATGFIHDLNKSQYETLLKFKEKLRNENIIQDFTYYDDLYMLRFLRARKFDLEKSFIMITDFFKWRAKENVDQAEHFEYPELMEVKKLYPHTYHKTDKLGRPIYIELLGEVKVSEVFKKTTKERMMRYYVREYERLMKYRFPACTKEKGQLVEQGFSILDLTGVSMSILSGEVKKFNLGKRLY
jgi:hypothetical protein